MVSRLNPDGWYVHRRIDANYDHLPVYVVADFDPNDRSTDGVYDLWMAGVARQVVRKGDPDFDLKEWLAHSSRALPRYSSGTFNPPPPAVFRSR